MSEKRVVLLKDKKSIFEYMMLQDKCIRELREENNEEVVWGVKK